MATTASKNPRAARKAAPARKTAAPAAKRPAAPREAAVARKAPVVKKTPAAEPKPEARKHKLVRDGFTMPQADFDLIATLKKRAIALGRPAKKSELLRAGLHALTRLDDAAMKAVLGGLIELKAGRPRKER